MMVNNFDRVQILKLVKIKELSQLNKNNKI
jgi:hypothetical protein